MKNVQPSAFNKKHNYVRYIVANYITIDGGTTNTRVNLVVDGNIVDKAFIPFGAKASIGNRDKLRLAIKDAITELLEKQKMTSADITRILASGMITSEHGLMEIPHIKTPAGKGELHSAMREVELNDISDIPFVFISGVRTDAKELCDIDIMRGEESEIFGIMGGLDGVYVLPGSHSKIVTVKDGKITDFKTMLTGEMIATLLEGTILKGSFDLSSASLDKEYLFRGYEYCRQHGINEALFKVRILKNVLKASENELYSFYMGIILYNEVNYIISVRAERIFVGGKKSLKDILTSLLEKYSSSEVVALDESVAANATTNGVIEIFEHNN